MNSKEKSFKSEFSKINTIDKFLEKLENNPKLVDNLSENRLDILINYYSEITQKNEENFKSNNNNVSVTVKKMKIKKKGQLCCYSTVQSAFCILSHATSTWSLAIY